MDNLNAIQTLAALARVQGTSSGPKNAAFDVAPETGRTEGAASGRVA